MVFERKLRWLGASTPGGPFVLLVSGNTYNRGDMLPAGALSEKMIEQYKEYGWIREEVDAPIIIKKTNEVVQPQQEVEEVTDVSDVVDEQVQTEIKMVENPPIEVEIKSGPKTTKKRGRKKRHG